MSRLHPLVKIVERPGLRPFGDQLQLDVEAVRYPCPSCGGSGVSRVRGTKEDLLLKCRTCEGHGTVAYDPADTSEIGF